MTKKTELAMKAYWETIKSEVCPGTEAGWIWYCDEHVTHGNADIENEAAAMADAHIRYFLGDITRREHAAAIFLWQVLDPPDDAG